MPKEKEEKESRPRAQVYLDDRKELKDYTKEAIDYDLKTPDHRGVTSNYFRALIIIGRKAIGYSKNPKETLKKALTLGGDYLLDEYDMPDARVKMAGGVPDRDKVRNGIEAFEKQFNLGDPGSVREYQKQIREWKRLCEITSEELNEKLDNVEHLLEKLEKTQK